MSASASAPTVLLIGTLDTKGTEYRFVRDRLRDKGIKTILVDFGVFGEIADDVDVSAVEVAERGGAQLAGLKIAREGSETRAHAMQIMTAGLTNLLKELLDAHQVDAVFGMGGSGGSSVISAVMRSAPVGVPKFLVSTMASGDVSGYVDISDLTIMHSVTDILGLNRVSRVILGNAAASIAGMALEHHESKQSDEGDRPLVAVTMFGVTTPCVRRVTDQLAERGFETVVFHAVGPGGRAMEMLISEGMVDAVVDITTSELVDGEFGGKFAGGPERMRSAVRAGIPTVMVPGAIEVLNFGTVASVPEKYNVPERKLIVHNTSVCAVRVNEDESRLLGTEFASRLKGSTGNIRMVIPTRGFSSYCQQPDGPWINPEADAAFIEAFEEANDGLVPVRKVAANINDPEFADAVVEEFMGVWGAISRGGAT